ncbi:MAG: hypothetical protein J5I53_11110 [Bradyrhizobiaceae bacterium]|nr:hypothetical protein [Bradyrhizobiaceae bacterium]
MQRLVLIFIVCGAVVCSAQIPQTITFQVYLEQGGIQFNGKHELVTRWYSTPTGGTPLHVESLVTDVVDGLATVVAGSAIPLPPGLLRSGTLWIGFSIDGGSELVPRTVLTSVPYALLADKALVAEALAPEVTGVVTSVNEVAGAVEIVGKDGIHVNRQGKTLTVSATNALQRGRIDALPGEYQFTIRLNNPFPPNTTIYAHVVSKTVVGVTVLDIDNALGEFTLIASAPLIEGEYILWYVQ